MSPPTFPPLELPPPELPPLELPPPELSLLELPLELLDPLDGEGIGRTGGSSEGVGVPGTRIFGIPISLFNPLGSAKAIGLLPQ